MPLGAWGSGLQRQFSLTLRVEQGKGRQDRHALISLALWRRLQAW